MLSMSCPARGMGVEIIQGDYADFKTVVMPREGHGSRNILYLQAAATAEVMPREGHGSRNLQPKKLYPLGAAVMPREGHGSRNEIYHRLTINGIGHAPRGAWE